MGIGHICSKSKGTSIAVSAVFKIHETLQVREIILEINIQTRSRLVQNVTDEETVQDYRF